MVNNKEEEKKTILYDLYASLGVEECYSENGGIGFGLIRGNSPYNVVLLNQVYNTLINVRKKTDETGVEYSFMLIGNFKQGKDNTIYFVCNNAIVDEECIVSSDGETHKSERFKKLFNQNVRSSEFVIMCHTHPSSGKVLGASTNSTFEESLIKHGNKLCLRDYGLNISNGDLLQLIKLKIAQKERDNDCYFLQGISLPNGEFNIIDIILNNNNSITGLPNVFRLENNTLIKLHNFWNADSRHISPSKS